MTPGTTDDSRNPKLLALVSWAVYDWANSAYPTIIQTFVFAAYFTRRVAENETTGSAMWGNTIGLAGILVAVCSPILGAAADSGGDRKLWIAILTLACCLATGGLWFVLPQSSSVYLGLVLLGLSTFTFELAVVLYNANLPDLSSASHLGRWSGWGWALGYAGGLISLIVVLFAFVRGEGIWLSLDPETFQHVRIAFPFVGGWYLVFSLPFFLWTPSFSDEKGSFSEAIRGGLKQLKATFEKLGNYSHVGLFLLARMVYIDGLATVFAFGGVYAAGTFEMSESNVLAFGIVLNVTAGLGAASMGWIDDWLGSKETILIGLGGLLTFGLLILLVTSVLWFWVFGGLLGIFVGPVQSASRSFLARLAPASLRNEMFGLYAFSGKATAFVGPFLVGWFTSVFNSQRIGMSIVLVFFVVGGIILGFVPRKT